MISCKKIDWYAKQIAQNPECVSMPAIAHILNNGSTGTVLCIESRVQYWKKQYTQAQTPDVTQ